MKKKVLLLFIIMISLVLFSGCNKKCKHKSTTWIVDMEATCSKEGSKHEECLECSETLKTEKIQKLEHRLTHYEGQDATCENDGYTAYDKCKDCGYTTYKVIKALGHKYINDVCTRCHLASSSNINYVLNSSKTGYIVQGLNNVNNVLKIVIPNIYNGLPVIGVDENAFDKCYNVQTIEFPNSLTELNQNALTNCISLIYNEYENGYYVGNTSNPYLILVKSKNPNITSVKINNNTKIILGCAFKNCINLKSVQIPSSVKSIGSYAFSGCTSLQSMELTENITNIGTFIFSGCTKLTDVTLPFLGSSKTDVTNATMSYSFETNVQSLRKIKILECTVLKSLAFNNCVNLTEVELPTGLISIGDAAFNYCTSLTNIIIPTTVTTIGEQAFRDCKSLTAIKLPHSVTSVGNGAFYGCSNLTTVKLSNQLISIPDNMFIHCTKLEDLWLPDTITKIGKFAFSETNISTIEIPSNVVSIGEYAFSDCKNLSWLYFSDDGKLETIGKYAFANCYGLFKVELPATITEIGSAAFYNCHGIQKMTVPFVGSDGIHNTNSHFGYIFGANSYKNNSGFVSKNLTEVKILGGNYVFANAFYGCSKIKKILISKNVNNMDVNAIDGSNDLLIYCEVSSKPNKWSNTWNKGANTEHKYICWGVDINNVYNYDGVDYILNENENKAQLLRAVENKTTLYIGKTIYIYEYEYEYEVTGFYKNAFEKATNLENVYYDGTIKDWCNISFSTAYSSPMAYAKHFCMRETNGEYKEITEIEIPGTISTIGDY